MDFSDNDLRQLAQRGITPEQVDQQLKQLHDGFPYLRVEAPATVGHGIVAPDSDARDQFTETWNRYKEAGHKVVKFVPASGAASRMFKDMFAFLNAYYDQPTTEAEKKFFDGIRQFAFREALCDACKHNEGKNLRRLLDEGQYKTIVANMLEPKGLNYGNLPKGLLLFHNYPEGPRTPMEEHLVEAALYAATGGKAHVHFTVSHDHLPLFQAKLAKKKNIYEERFHVQYNVSFSEQLLSTDTIAANPDGTPFRTDDGSLLFRPGGHGALIQNLNHVDADIVFIKNIDNVVPDRLKPEDVTYKQLLAGLLVSLQHKAFSYLRLLDSGEYNHAQLEEIIRFLQRDLCCRRPDIKELEDADLVIYLRRKLNRPMRVCGMVRNVGEPGGGPFLVWNADGTLSLQILEQSQIDRNDPESARMFASGTHFNPVDLVCALKDYQGRPFDLTRHIDPNTGFISNKSKYGRELKALELPGLWNGAMSDWNTVFVEVPLATFNPVKTVCDLLRPQHQ